MSPRRRMLPEPGQAGSALVPVLVVVTVLSVLLMVVLQATLAQYRFIRREAHRLQARYAAEAGVYAAMDSLQHDPWWTAAETMIPLPLGQESRVTIEPYGGYLWIRSEARYRRSRSAVRALVGEVPPPDFQRALILWDAESSLHVAGATRIVGDVVVGGRGLRQSTFKRRRFSGRIDGRVHTVPDLRPPFFTAAFLFRGVDDAERLLRAQVSAPSVSERVPPPALQLPSRQPVVVAPGDRRVTAADSLWLRQAAAFVAHGNLIVEGPLHVTAGTRFVAGGTLRVTGDVTGRDGLFYGREEVIVEAGVRCGGQFASRATVRVTRGAVLTYPSVLFVTGEAAASGGRLHVEDGAVVNGTLVHPPLDPPPVGPRGRVVVDPRAQVRGALYNAHETELLGTFLGTVMTRLFYTYESPTHYVNWLTDVTIDVTERPVSFVLPLLFSPSPRLAVLRWDVQADEPDVLR